MSWGNPKQMKYWTEAEIIDWYDRHPDIIISEYAKNLGIKVERLKNILM